MDQMLTYSTIKYANTRRKVESSLPQITSLYLIGLQSLGDKDILSYQWRREAGAKSQKPCNSLLKRNKISKEWFGCPTLNT